jgi:hypothetical protein
MARPSIAIVVAFFGQAPQWLPAFLLSCRENRDVQWFMYTDFEVTPATPANVTVKHMEIRDLNLRSSEVLGTKIEIQRSLAKVNDLKPAYGLIFADDLRPFDYWAYSDLDIIWGDIRHFVTDSLLNENDIVSSRADRLSGHFTLFRNTVQTNRTIELIPDLREALAHPRYRHLDERGLTRHLRDRLARTPPPSWPCVYWRQNWTLSAAYQKALGDTQADRLWWRNGRTFAADGKELMYLHFNKLKQHMTTINFGFDETPAAFTINRTGFSAI